ncbi:transposase [Solibacillus silvestris]|uniref:transposase n=1 Tax=Solibacillus silvestris TaxID=76853 RepID=UPI003F82289F
MPYPPTDERTEASSPLCGRSKRRFAIYRQRKIDEEPVFGFPRANLGFMRLYVRGKSKVHHEIGMAVMAANLRKYTARG